MSSINRDYIDINLVSGSSERLRTLLESSWEVVSSSEKGAVPAELAISLVDNDSKLDILATLPSIKKVNSLLS